MSKAKNHRIVPRLRFPGFQGAAGWIVKPLKNICEVNPSSTDIPEKFFYIDLESVDSGALKVRKTIFRDEAPSRAQRLLQNGDVIFQVVRPYQRNNLHFRSDGEVPYVASTGYAQLRAQESGDFLFQAVHTDIFVDRVIAKCTGSSYPAISSSDLADILLAVPSEAEQKQIAACLSSLDDLITLEAQKLGALKTHKKGLMQQLFPAEGETVSRLRFPEFRGDNSWKARQLERIGLIVTGKTPNTKDSTLWNGSVQFVTPTDISDQKYQWKTQRYVTESNAGKILPKHSTMFTCIASIGKISLSVHPCITNQQINSVIPYHDYDKEFVYYSLLSLVPNIRDKKSDSTLPIINKTEFSKYQILVPSSFGEQKKIADCLSSLDDLITAQAQKVETLKTHKKGLMQQLFPVLDDAVA